MRRLFWVALGAAAGIYIARRVTGAAHSVTPAALSDSLAGSVRELGDAARYFADQVREGMTQREGELYAALGIGPDGAAVSDTPGAQER